MTNKNNRRNNRPVSEYQQKIIDLARVTRVMGGGKRMRFRVCLAIGDGKGKVGIGLAKGADVSIAVSKAFDKAKKNTVKIPLVKSTIPHRLYIKKGAAKILLKPAPQGTGIKAGGAVRQVLELGGSINIVGKILGTNNKVNNVKALIAAFKSFKVVDSEKKKDVKKDVKPKESKVIKKEKVVSTDNVEKKVKK